MHPARLALGGHERRSRLDRVGVLTRLADILVIQAIRAWIRSEPLARSGWLGALGDPQLGPALARVHRDPAHP